MQSITLEHGERKKVLFRLSITGDFPPASYGGNRSGKTGGKPITEVAILLREGNTAIVYNI